MTVRTGTEWNVRAASGWAIGKMALTEAVRAFGRNRGLERAATLAYFGFFASIPMLLIAVFLLGRLIASSDSALQAIDGLTADLSPLLNQVVMSEVGAISAGRAWSMVSVLVLLWSAMPLASALRTSFTAIFSPDHEIRFWRAVRQDAVAVLMFLVMVLLVVAGQALSTALSAGWLHHWAWTVRTVSMLIRMLVAVGCCGLFYLALVPVTLRPRLLWSSALLTTLLVIPIQPLLGLALRFNPDYGFAFGSLKAIFLMFLWSYYCFSSLLLAAEFTAAIHRREAIVLKNLFQKPEAVSTALLRSFTHTYSAGHVLFREGEPSREFFYIISGRVELSIGGKVLAVMKEHEYFGEMATLINSNRTATATIVEEGTVLASVSEENLDFVLGENPRIVLRVLREMANRLKTSVEKPAV